MKCSQLGFKLKIFCKQTSLSNKQTSVEALSSQKVYSALLPPNSSQNIFLDPPTCPAKPLNFLHSKFRNLTSELGSDRFSKLGKLEDLLSPALCTSRLWPRRSLNSRIERGSCIILNKSSGTGERTTMPMHFKT